MSKLRANITYSHRLKSDEISESIISDINIDELFINQNRETNRENNDTIDDINVLTRKGNDEISIEEESDDETDQTNLENEFCDYLQGWEDMLKEEESADYEDNSDDFNESDDNIVNNITHPANDINAKWMLVTLFKNDLKLPF
jgi:hypothetical protein